MSTDLARKMADELAKGFGEGRWATTHAAAACAKVAEEHYAAERALLPAENMALTVARAQSLRGDSVPPNTALMLVMTIERLASLEATDA